MKIILRQPAILLLLILLTAAVAGRADQVDDYVKAAMAGQHVPGVAIAVVKDGKIVKTAGYGFANLELGAAVKPETVFKIGSVSKQFLAAGILLLIEEGKLGLDDPVGGAWPSYTSSTRPPGGRPGEGRAAPRRAICVPSCAAVRDIWAKNASSAESR